MGDRITTLNGSATVAAIHALAGDEAMYNLTVANAHTYYVGAAGALVHNTCLNEVNINRLDGLGISEDQIDILEQMCQDCSGGQGSARFNNFLSELTDDQIQDLIANGNNRPTNLPQGVTLEGTNFTSGNTDAYVYEYLATGKPNPNVAVYVNGTEFDWYQVQPDGTIILQDAKFYNPGGYLTQVVEGRYVWTDGASILDAAQRQINAISKLPAGTQIQWLVPDVQVAADLQVFLNEHSLSAIQVIVG
jgi:hypothetical protein